jgi:predicted phosphodiesterase
VDWEELLKETELVLEKESRLILLPVRGKAVFVGDTHGDLDATQRVIRRFLKPPYLLIFLGDYVDRGAYSRENLLYLLQIKRKHPKEIFLLAGNHEGYQVKEFYPADFWNSLPPEREVFGHLFSKFQVAAISRNGVLALHGHCLI